VQSGPPVPPLLLLELVLPLEELLLAELPLLLLALVAPLLLVLELACPPLLLLDALDPRPLLEPPLALPLALAPPLLPEPPPEALPAPEEEPELASPPAPVVASSTAPLEPDASSEAVLSGPEAGDPPHAANQHGRKRYWNILRGCMDATRERVLLSCSGVPPAGHVAAPPRATNVSLLPPVRLPTCP
jgi:hypothetical protein